MRQEYYSKYTQDELFKRDKRFLDLDASFKINPNTGDLAQRKDEKAIIFAVKNILLTHPGERPFNPIFGAAINNSLFELSPVDVKILLTEVISNALANFEPRVDLVQVDVDSTVDINNSIRINVVVRIKNMTEDINIPISLKRTR